MANYNAKWGSKLGKNGIYRKQTVDVKSLPSNQWGLYEMHGNVWEWCSDWYESYNSEPVENPKGPDRGAFRVLRGGSWFRNGRIVRSTVRSHGGPDLRGGIIGFRLARRQ